MSGLGVLFFFGWVRWSRVGGNVVFAKFVQYTVYGGFGAFLVVRWSRILSRFRGRTLFRFLPRFHGIRICAFRCLRFRRRRCFFRQDAIAQFVGVGDRLVVKPENALLYLEGDGLNLHGSILAVREVVELP